MEMENRIIEVRDIWDGDWYWIQRVVFEDYTPKIGVIGLALYNAYSSYARDKGIAFPSQKTLAEKLGLSIKTVIKYNRILEANGLIRIERRKGKGKTNLVTLLKVGNVNQFHAHPVTGSVKVVKGVNEQS
jgi:biotin operon repressor